MSEMNQLYEMNKPAVAFQVMDGETVLINFDTGFYFSINATGTKVVEALENGASPSELMADPSDVGKEKLLEFFDHLLAEGLARKATLPRALELSLPVPLTLSESEVPELHAFADLRDVLMLDPIHDVAASGWPNLPAGN